MSIMNNVIQWSPTFLVPGTSFMEGSFSIDWGHKGCSWFGDDSSTLYLLCTLFPLLLYQLHLRSSGIRYQRLGTLDVINNYSKC